jgi:hypothetical protein
MLCGFCEIAAESFGRVPLGIGTGFSAAICPMGIGAGFPLQPLTPEFKNLTQQFTKINFVAWNLKSINDYALLSE